MARLPIDLPRMQNQPRPRVPAARGPNLVPLDGEAPPPKPRKPRKTRQYELIDQVKQYNPKTNEELLNRAYVYAMRAHGGQKRASGNGPAKDLSIATPPAAPAGKNLKHR